MRQRFRRHFLAAAPAASVPAGAIGDRSLVAQVAFVLVAALSFRETLGRGPTVQIRPNSTLIQQVGNLLFGLPLFSEKVIYFPHNGDLLIRTRHEDDAICLEALASTAPQKFLRAAILANQKPTQAVSSRSSCRGRGSGRARSNVSARPVSRGTRVSRPGSPSCAIGLLSGRP